MDRYWFKVERNICDNSRKKKNAGLSVVSVAV